MTCGRAEEKEVGFVKYGVVIDGDVISAEELEGGTVQIMKKIVFNENVMKGGEVGRGAE